MAFLRIVAQVSLRVAGSLPPPLLCTHLWGGRWQYYAVIMLVVPRDLAQVLPKGSVAGIVQTTWEGSPSPRELSL